MLPDAIAPSGEDGTPDKSACWTGSVIEHRGLFHLFYTGGNFDEKTGWQTVCHATSEDLIHWDKNPANPILRADDRWYEPNDWRDPFVYWSERDDRFHMLITARSKTGWPQRRGCLALATSGDLSSWEVHPPMWEPRIGHALECPERFRIGSREYLAFSTYSDDHVTHYRQIDADGEVVSPPLMDQLDTPYFYAAKGLSDGTRRITFGWFPESVDDTDAGKIMWGGHLGIPHVLTPSDGGRLAIYYPESYRSTIGSAHPFTKVDQVGDWQAATDPPDDRGRAPGGAAYTLFGPQPQRFYLTLGIQLDEGSHAAGLILNAERDMGRGYRLEFNNAIRSLRLLKYRPHPPWDSSPPDFPRRTVLVERILPFALSELEVELFYEDGLFTVFINRSEALSARVYEPGQYFGIWVQSGSARFHDLAVHELAEA